MQEVHIDRLILKLSGLTEDEGRRLAMKVSEGLAAADISNAAVENPGALRLDLRASPREQSDVDSLAHHIVSGIVRELSRSA
ncbi:hypothetical protein [Polyangium mundeleinium]|uniref:Uncharacterized protein n=1 Tax=Polyangium mundeleinium TaxID=2995306 RepID=A0ABT5ESM8_9BACT|nr:hypothetical protein [Polyangium mundeleinium]MDC0744827.1 hypothetical protein [Polyangium mundeleinium]